VQYGSALSGCLSPSPKAGFGAFVNGAPAGTGGLIWREFFGGWGRRPRRPGKSGRSRMSRWWWRHELFWQVLEWGGRDEGE